MNRNTAIVTEAPRDKSRHFAGVLVNQRACVATFARPSA